MADIFKTFIKHMDGVNKAAVADAAAKAMAEHCDARIERYRIALRPFILAAPEPFEGTRSAKVTVSVEALRFAAATLTEG